MKKLFLILFAAIAVQFAAAQTAESVIAKFAEKTGIEKFKADRDGKTSYLEIDINVGPMVMPIKVTAKYPSLYRIEMEAQGQAVLMIMRDTTAWVKAAGQIQKMEGKDKMAQIAPVSDIISAIIPDLKEYELTYAGQQGKGKNLCDVVEFKSKKDKSTGKFFFNVETGLLESIDQMNDVMDKLVNVKTKFKDYTKFADGTLELPKIMEATSPMGNIVMTINAFELDYPTAAWMFAEPK